MTSSPTKTCLCRTTADLAASHQRPEDYLTADILKRPPFPTAGTTSGRHKVKSDKNWSLSMRKDYALFPRGKFSYNYATITALMPGDYSNVYEARDSSALNTKANAQNAPNFSDAIDACSTEEWGHCTQPITAQPQGENPELCVCESTRITSSRLSEHKRKDIRQLLTLKPSSSKYTTNQHGILGLGKNLTLSLDKSESITFGCGHKNCSVVGRLTLHQQGRIMMARQSARKSVIQIHDEMLKVFSNNGFNTNTNSCVINEDNFDADSLNDVVIEELDATNLNVIDGDNEVISGSSSDQDLTDQQHRKTSSDSNFVSDFSGSDDEVDFDSLEVAVIVENVSPASEVQDLALAQSDPEESTSDSQNITPPRPRRKKTLKRRKRRHDILFSNSEHPGVQVSRAHPNLRNRSRSECIRHDDNSDSSCSSTDQGYDSFGRRDQFYSDVPYLISSPPSSSTTYTELRRSYSLPPGFKPGAKVPPNVKPGTQLSTGVKPESQVLTGVNTKSQVQPGVKPVTQIPTYFKSESKVPKGDSSGTQVPKGDNSGSLDPPGIDSGSQMPPGFKPKQSVTSANKPESMDTKNVQNSSTTLADIIVPGEKISKEYTADFNLISKVPDSSNDPISHYKNINSSTINADIGKSSARSSNHYSVIDLTSLSFNSPSFNEQHDDLLLHLRSLPPTTSSSVVASSTCTVSPLKCVTSEEFIPYVSPLSPYAFTQPVARQKTKAVGKRSCVILSFLMGGFGLTLLIITLSYLTPVLKSGIPVY